MADSVVKLRIDSKEYDANIKRAGEALTRYFDTVKKGGRTLAHLDDGVKDAVRAIGSMETKSNTSKGKLRELTDAFTELSMRMNKMSEEEKKVLGKDLQASLDQLKTRIQNTRSEISDVNSSLGDWRDSLGGLGSQLGISSDLMSVFTTGTITMTAGITAGAAAIAAATKAWAEYNAEIAKQDQIATVTTGLKGEDADRLTDSVRALSQTYDVDFREAINAANTLMTQFGATGDEAMQLLRDGMQGMIQGDGGKMLSMIQQFAPSFRDAGISASQLVAIIQNSEGGIFTDENMNAIVMGIKNIRLMTNSTSEALQKVGIDGKEMTRQLNDGSLTIFEAMKQVSTAIQGVGSGSQDAGEVMQQVFGRQGTAAGTNLAVAIETLNTNLEETKLQTGEVGEAFANLQSANERLNGVLRETFQVGSWQEMSTEIKTSLIGAITDVIEGFYRLKEAGVDTWKSLSSSLGPLVNFITATLIPGIYNAKTAFNEFADGGKMAIATVKAALTSLLGPLGNVVSLLQALGNGSLTSNINNRVIQTANDKVNETKDRLLNPLKGLFGGGRSRGGGGGTVTPIVTTPKTSGGKGGGGGGTPTPEKELTIQQQIAALEKEALTASEDRVEEIRKQIMALDEVLEKEKELKDFLHGKEKEPDLDALFPEVATESSDSNPLQNMKDSINFKLAEDNIEVDEASIKNLLQYALQAGIDDMDLDFASLLEMLAEGLDVPDDAYQGIIDKINEIRTAAGEEPIELDVKTGNVNETAKVVKASWKDAAGSIGQAASALAGLENPAAKITGMIGAAIAQIALGFATSTTQEAKGGVWYWIAAVAAGLATMISTISAIHSNTGYAEGGIVKGNSYSGDNLYAGNGVAVNSGELILNRVQQGILADSLQGGGLDNLRLSTEVSGRSLRVVLNNDNKVRGYGKIVTTNKM